MRYGPRRDRLRHAQIYNGYGIYDHELREKVGAKRRLQSAYSGRSQGKALAYMSEGRELQQEIWVPTLTLQFLPNVVQRLV